MSEERTVTETRDVTGFEGVALGGTGAVTITQGDRAALTIEADPDVMPRVTSEVRGGLLHLGLKRGGWLKGLRHKKLSIKFNVTLPEIRELRLSGVGRIDAPRIDTDALSLALSGAGAMEIGALEAKSLSVVVSGTGNCEIAGHVDSQTVKLSGAGNYRAPELVSRTADAVISGVGDVTIYVQETLDAKLTGAGSIRYNGAPTVRQRVTGVGRVVCTCNE